MRSTTVFLLLCVSILSPILAPALAQADVMYRWIDKDGVLNYSQVEPQGVKAEKVITRGSITASTTAKARSSAGKTDPDAPALDGLPPAEDGPKLTAEQQRKLDELKALHAQEEQKVADIRKANCDKSRSVLERLTQSARIRVREGSGDERVIGEDERQKRIQEAQVGIASNCNGDT